MWGPDNDSDSPTRVDACDRQIDVVLAYAVMAAPALLAEVFIDAFIVSALYRHLRIAAEGNWLGTAVRKTWLLALAAAALLCLAGWCLEMLAPGAHSIDPAIEKLLHS